MGAFVASSRWIAGHLGETVGYKAGLALTREEIAAHLSDAPDFRDAVLLAEDRQVRVRSEDYESVVNKLLHRVGNIPSSDPLPPVAQVYRRYGHETPHNEIIDEVLTRCLELLDNQIENSPQGKPLDPVQLVEPVAAEFGPSGRGIAVALIKSIALQLHITPWAPVVGSIGTIRLICANCSIARASKRSMGRFSTSASSTICLRTLGRSTKSIGVSSKD